jgi:hypothetical protein
MQAANLPDNKKTGRIRDKAENQTLKSDFLRYANHFIFDYLLHLIVCSLKNIAISFGE